MFTSEKKRKWNWLLLQPEQFIFITEKPVAIKQFASYTEPHNITCYYKEANYLTKHFHLLYYLFSFCFGEGKSSKSYFKTAVWKLVVQSKTPDFILSSLLFNLSSQSEVHSVPLPYNDSLFPKDCKCIWRNFFLHHPSCSFLRISYSIIALFPLPYTWLLKC